MAVIEAMMMLFIKEQVVMEKVLNTVKRFSAPVSASEAPADPEAALLLWTKRCCEALKLRLEADLGENEVKIRYAFFHEKVFVNILLLSFLMSS